MVLTEGLSPDLQSQEKEAKDEMKRKAKELQMAKREARKEGRSMYSGGYGGSGFGSHDMRGGGMGPSVETLPPPETKKSYAAPRWARRKQVLCVCLGVKDDKGGNGPCQLFTWTEVILIYWS